MGMRRHPRISRYQREFDGRSSLGYSRTLSDYHRLEQSLSSVVADFFLAGNGTEGKRVSKFVQNGFNFFETEFDENLLRTFLMNSSFCELIYLNRLSNFVSFRE